MHKCTSYGPYKLNLWPFWPLFEPMTLTFNLPEKIFQMALLLFEDNNCAKPFWNQYINVQVMALTSSLHKWPFWQLFDPCDLDLQPTWKNVSNCTSPLRGQQPCNFFFCNPCINVQVMARTSSIYDHFDLYLTPVTLTFNLHEKNVLNGTSPQGQQLCKIILKSMHKCISYAPNKLNTCIWPFWPVFDPCDLDHQPA